MRFGLRVHRIPSSNTYSRHAAVSNGHSKAPHELCSQSWVSHSFTIKSLLPLGQIPWSNLQVFRSLVAKTWTEGILFCRQTCHQVRGLS